MIMLGYGRATWYETKVQWEQQGLVRWPSKIKGDAISPGSDVCLYLLSKLLQMLIPCEKLSLVPTRHTQNLYGRHPCNFQRKSACGWQLSSVRFLWKYFPTD